jgi:1-acyl-sn-glycerol-3-phosphate acyltransferase
MKRTFYWETDQLFKFLILYFLLKIWVWLGLQFYCKRIHLKFKDHGKVAVILACNHPNSFLDALIIGSHYKTPIHFLARGDAFSNRFMAWLLRRMNMIPIYRINEGKQHLKQNEASFAECLQVLQRGGIILIFSEGICKNEWSLRPLKKGTARLAWMAINEKDISNLEIAPVSLSYSSFTKLPLSVSVIEGKTAVPTEIKEKEQPIFFNKFNELLRNELNSNIRSEAKMLEGKISKSGAKQYVILIPAFIGWLTHKGFYNFWKEIAYKRTTGTVFYCSVLFGLLLISYPITLMLLTTLTVLITGSYYFSLLLILLPFTAWCYKEYRS